MSFCRESEALYRTVRGCAQDDTRGEFFRSLLDA
jgi:hypothetical protein